ncbi:hypothetical protein TRVA0_059S00144 [Trichomonascus vanleenenianus]|uniref:PalH/RIM21 family protein n=1 Tax=Trichomonascus vanleenenianus TaxID=2268995 RepID=UPI003ECB94C6
MPTGTVVVNGSTVLNLSQIHNATFQPKCDSNGYLVVPITNQTSLMDILYPSVGNNHTFVQWEFPFSQSSIPLIYAVAGSTVAIWLLFFGLVTSKYRRPLYLYITALITVITISLMSADVLQFVRHQYYRGFTDGGAIENLLLDSVKVEVARIIATTCLLLQDVRTVVRLFGRKREKLLIYFCGNLFVITSTVLMVANLFAPEPDKRKDSVDALIVFGYLFSIATAILFEFCIVYYTITMFPLVLSKGIILLTIISNLLAMAPVVLFILDLVREDIYMWMNQANLAALMGASISAWTWVDRLEHKTQEKQLNSVLGRQYYNEDRILDLEVGSDSSIRREKKPELARSSATTSDTTDSSDGSGGNAFTAKIAQWYKDVISFRPGTSSSSGTRFIITSRSSNNATPAEPTEEPVLRSSSSDDTNLRASSTNEISPAPSPSSQTSSLQKFHHEFRR